MMRAISLHQPWASLMALGEKTIETRGQRTHIRGDVAICATARFHCWTPTAPIREALARYGVGDMSEWPLGKVLCVVEIYECLTTDYLRTVEPFAELPFGDYSPGRFAWRTRNLRTLKEPVPVKGAQGFFFLPADVEAKVRAQL